MADGEELLIVDANDRDRSGLVDIFRKDGFMVTALTDTRTARERLLDKFFPVMIVDFDVKPDGGLGLLRFAHERSPQTSVILLCSKQSFSMAVEAFRLGAVDVFHKDPKEIDSMRKRVERACLASQSSSDNAAISSEVLAMFEEAIRIMMGLYDKQPAVRKKIQAIASREPIILVDDNDNQAQDIIKAGEERGLRFELVQLGGQALDLAAQLSPSIIAVKDQLPDLPGKLVAKNIQAQYPQTLVVVYMSPSPGSFAELYVRGNPHEVLRPLDSPASLVEHLSVLALRSNAIDMQRKVFDMFKTEQVDFLKRYAKLKVRIEKLAKT